MSLEYYDELNTIFHLAVTASGSSDQSSESSEQIKLDPIHELAVSGDVEGLRLEIKRDRSKWRISD